MKILKIENIKKIKEVKTFNCNFCGCLFEANNSEYYINSQYNQTYYYITCPFCGTMYMEQYREK